MKKVKLSVQARVLNRLQRGQTITPKQIRASYKVSNPHDVVYQLECQGHWIDRTYTQHKNGRTTVKYHM